MSETARAAAAFKSGATAGAAEAAALQLLKTLPGSHASSTKLFWILLMGASAVGAGIAGWQFSIPSPEPNRSLTAAANRGPAIPDEVPAPKLDLVGDPLPDGALVLSALLAFRHAGLSS